MTPKPLLLPADRASIDILHLASLGSIFATLSQFELLLESIVRRELRITTEETCIVCGGLGGGAKTGLTFSLLSRDAANAPLIAALRHVQNIGSRNALAHGFLYPMNDRADFELIAREVKEKLRVKRSHLRANWRMNQLLAALQEAMRLANITNDDIHAYATEIANLAPSP
jgi:hypothetical protein